MQKREELINIYDVIPKPISKYEIKADGKVVLLKPKFKNSLFVKYIMPKMKSLYYKINLDELGSAVWKRIDGSKNASEIGKDLENEFGGKIQPTFDRLMKFLTILKRNRFIDF